MDSTTTSTTHKSCSTQNLVKAPRNAPRGSASYERAVFPPVRWVGRIGRALLSATAIAWLLATSASVLAASPPLTLPTLGDGLELSLAQERRIGESIIRTLYRDPDYVDDPALQEYVEGIVEALLAAARTRGELSAELDERLAWEVLLGRDRSINAFALPGGFMGVHLGLLGVVSSRDELASVLAHELSHVTQRHIARLLAQQSRQTPLMLGAMVLGALAASKNPQAAQAMLVGGQALAVQNQLNFSRDMEREADRVGYGLMAPAGFAPQGFVSMFDKLQQAHRLNDNGHWPYLRSHPLTTQRIADMQSRLPNGGPLGALASTLEHALLAARARVLSRPPAETLHQWIALPQGRSFAAEPPLQRAAAWYAAVLAQGQLREFASARQMLTPLRALVHSDAAALRQVQLLAAQLELKADQPQAALSILDTLGSSAAKAPTARPELVLRSQALLQLQRTAQISAALETWLATHPRDALLWQMLAQVEDQQGQPLRALRAEAESHAAHYDYPAALDRLHAAQELARQQRSAADYVQASIVDTRLRALEALVREQAAER